MKNNRQGLILIFSGPSGSGKGTILKKVMETEKNLFLSVSATTRSPRPGEEHGVHYSFISGDEFEGLIASDGMLEYAGYCGNYYGTPRSEVRRRTDRGEDVVLEIEVQGAMQVMEKCPEAVSVFIMPPSMEELKNRLVGRQTEEMSVVERRLRTAREEVKLAKEYDYIVYNHTVEQAAGDLTAILRAERCRASRVEVLED